MDESEILTQVTAISSYARQGIGVNKFESASDNQQQHQQQQTETNADGHLSAAGDYYSRGGGASPKSSPIESSARAAGGRGSRGGKGDSLSSEESQQQHNTYALPPCGRQGFPGDHEEQQQQQQDHWKGPPRLASRKVEAVLQERELWRAFNTETNEMIVTKGGRRMFPVIKISLDHLDPGAMYSIAIEFVQMESHRWKYVNGEWVPGGKCEPSSSRSLYVHPESPNFGAHWMKDPITFSKAKLTNKPTSQPGQVVLNSLHKYQPRVHVIKVRTDNQRQPYQGGPIETFEFPETQFIAVTAYQNESVSSQPQECRKQTVRAQSAWARRRVCGPQRVGESIGVRGCASDEPRPGHRAVPRPLRPNLISCISESPN